MTEYVKARGETLGNRNSNPAETLNLINKLTKWGQGECFQLRLKLKYCNGRSNTESEGKGYRMAREMFDNPAFLIAVGKAFAADAVEPEKGLYEVTFGQLAMSSFKVGL